MKKIINYSITTISIIVYVLLLFIYQMDSNYLKEIKYIYILAIPCFMILISTFLIQNKEIKKKNLYLYLIIYLIVLIGFVFSSARTRNLHITSGIRHYNYNFIPFKSMIDLLNSPLGLKFALYNIVGNFLMLTPLSVLLPLISDKFKKISKFIISILILTLSIELIQFIINIGSFDIDDFILNVSGAVLAFVLLTKTKLMNFFNNIFLNLNIKNKYGRYCLNTFYFLLLIGSLLLNSFNVYAIVVDYNIRNPKIDISALVCLDNKKTYITDYNNYHYYSNCNYGNQKVVIGSEINELEDFVKNKFFKSEYEEKLGIIKQEIITDIKLDIEDQLGKKLLTTTTFGDKVYFYNISSMTIIQDGNNYDYEQYLEDLKAKKNTVNIDLGVMSDVVYVDRNDEYIIEKGEYYQVLRCRIGSLYDGVSYNYYLPIEFEISNKSCSFLNGLDEK